MKEPFRQLHLFFLILLSGQILFWLAVIFINSGPERMAREEKVDIFSTLIPIFILSMTFAIYLIDKQRRKRGVHLSDLREKFRFYRNSVFLRLMLMESTNIFAIVIIIIEGKLYYSVYFLIGLMAFIYFRPSVLRFAEEYNLSEEEKKEILQE